MAVTKKNTTADGDQGAKVGGSDVTVNHKRSERLVTVAVQTADVTQVTVVVNCNGSDQKNGSKTEGETPRSPSKTNPWIEFLKQNKGKNFTTKQLAALYHEKQKKQHESITTDGS